MGIMVKMTTFITRIISNSSMEKIFQIVTIASLLVALFATVSLMAKQASAIYEDQILVCNFDNNCVIIDIDDFMNKEKSDHLWSIFNNNIDTFSTEDIGDLRN